MNFTRYLLNYGKLSNIKHRCMSASTIFSLSSGHGKCGVSVIRVSGPQTMQAMRAIVSDKFEPKPRSALLRSLCDPTSKEMIDRGLVLWFPGPYSFTGEDSCEFQVHGSLAVIAAMLEALGNVPGLRAAKPGEFTKRAFFGGKLDLTEVEGLADLIHAETEAQRRQALLQSNGSLSRLYHNWRKRLIRCIAHMEAYIDFAEDENIEDDIVCQLKTELQRLQVEIARHLNDHRQGEMLRDGIRTAIVGAPNVGKSSFMNLICQRNVSIVTSIAGTTRDIIESTYNIAGFPVVFSDTAGLRTTTDDLVEREGIHRAKECLAQSDFVILVIDAEDLCRHVSVGTDGEFSNFKTEYLAKLGISKEALEGKRLLVIANKIDLVPKDGLENLQRIPNLTLLSCKEMENVEGVMDTLAGQLKDLCGNPTAENPRLTNSRYRQELSKCIEQIKVFLEDYSPDKNPDLAIAAQKLRQAVKCIERITGDVSTDEILDVVFRDFCIGK